LFITFLNMADSGHVSVTLRHVGITMISMEKQLVLHILIVCLQFVCLFVYYTFSQSIHGQKPQDIEFVILLTVDLYVQKMNIKVDEVCRIRQTALENMWTLTVVHTSIPIVICKCCLPLIVRFYGHYGLFHTIWTSELVVCWEDGVFLPMVC
jgi:membrane-associated HD superfamily phosphohydrolase